MLTALDTYSLLQLKGMVHLLRPDWLANCSNSICGISLIYISSEIILISITLNNYQHYFTLVFEANILSVYK